MESQRVASFRKGDDGKGPEREMWLPTPSPNPPWPPSLTFKVWGAGKISHALPSRAGFFSWGCHTGGSDPRGLSRKSSRGRLLC